MSSYSSPLAVIEIGTSRTVCMVGQISEDAQVKVLGWGSSPTTGIRKGEVTELKFAVRSIRTAVEEAAGKARCDIRTADLIFSGGTFVSLPCVGRVVLQDRAQAVEQDDIEEARSLARSSSIPDGRQVIHSVVQNYVLDDSRVVMNPEGLPARILQANMLLMHTDRQSLEAMCSAIEDAQIDLSSCVFSAFCAGLATLSAEQKRAGVLLIHMGGGTTTYLAYADERLAVAGSFAVGGDHVTNDILQAFHLTSQKTAEWLKINQGSAILDGTTAVDRVTIPANSTLGAIERNLSQRSLNTVINARLDETFKILRSTLVHGGILSKLGAGVVLTGGMAYQDGITKLAGRVFETPCQVGILPGTFESGDDQPAALAATYGALVLAAGERLEQDYRRSRGWFNWFRKGVGL